MTYKLEYAQQPNYLHVIVTGQNSLENVTRYFDDILLECSKRHCRRLLVEERLDGERLNTLEVFKLVSEGSVKYAGKFTNIAYVDVNAAGKRMRFAETVAVNRALPVRVFATVGEAETWLAQD